MKFILSLCLSLCLFAGAVQAQEMKPEELFAKPEFQKAAPEAQLQQINQLIVDKKIQSSSFGNLVNRIFWQVLTPVQGAAAKLEKYGATRTLYADLPQSYDMDLQLIEEYLATDATAMAADLPGKLTLVYKLEKEKKVSWPGAAPIYTGLLTSYLAQEPKFQAADTLGKVNFIKALETNATVPDMISAPFMRMIVLEGLANAKDADKKALYDSLYEQVGFFAKSALEGGYLEFKK